MCSRFVSTPRCNCRRVRLGSGAGCQGYGVLVPSLHGSFLEERSTATAGQRGSDCHHGLECSILIGPARLSRFFSIQKGENAGARIHGQSRRQPRASQGVVATCKFTLQFSSVYNQAEGASPKQARSFRQHCAANAALAIRQSVFLAVRLAIFALAFFFFFFFSRFCWCLESQANQPEPRSAWPLAAPLFLEVWLLFPSLHPPLSPADHGRFAGVGSVGRWRRRRWLNILFDCARDCCADVDLLRSERALRCCWQRALQARHPAT